MSRAGTTNKIQRDAIVRKLTGQSFSGDVYLVGGALREIFLDASPKDYDFVLTDETDLSIFEAIFGGSSFILGKKIFQTRRIVVLGVSLDITFIGGDIESDLKRRDFTMNAIAFDVREGRVLDPLDGLGDIEKKIIRYPSKAVLSDDPLRMLKAIRHFAVLPCFSLHYELAGAIRELRGLIHHAAPERIKSELDQIMTSGRIVEGMKALEETGLLFEIVPELDALRKMDVEKGFILETYGHTVDGFKYVGKYCDRYDLDTNMRRLVGYALLFHDLGKACTFTYDAMKNAIHFYYHEKHSCERAGAIMERLRFSGSEIRTVLQLIENHMRIFLISGGESSDRAVRRLVYKMGHLSLALIVLTMCDLFGSSGGIENESTGLVEDKCEEIMKAYYEWKREPLPRLVSGHDILGLGFKPGPIIGVILSDIREKQIAGELKEKNEAIRYAMSLGKQFLS